MPAAACSLGDPLEGVVQEVVQHRRIHVSEGVLGAPGVGNLAGIVINACGGHLPGRQPRVVEFIVVHVEIEIPRICLYVRDKLRLRGLVVPGELLAVHVLHGRVVHKVIVMVGGGGLEGDRRVAHVAIAGPDRVAENNGPAALSEIVGIGNVCLPVVDLGARQCVPVASQVILELRLHGGAVEEVQRPYAVDRHRGFALGVHPDVELAKRHQALGNLDGHHVAVSERAALFDLDNELGKRHLTSGEIALHAARKRIGDLVAVNGPDGVPEDAAAQNQRVHVLQRHIFAQPVGVNNVSVAAAARLYRRALRVNVLLNGGGIHREVHQEVRVRRLVHRNARVVQRFDRRGRRGCDGLVGPYAACFFGVVDQVVGPGVLGDGVGDPQRKEVVLPVIAVQPRVVRSFALVRNNILSRIVHGNNARHRLARREGFAARSRLIHLRVGCVSPAPVRHFLDVIRPAGNHVCDGDSVLSDGDADLRLLPGNGIRNHVPEVLLAHSVGPQYRELGELLVEHRDLFGDGIAVFNHYRGDDLRVVPQLAVDVDHAVEEYLKGDVLRQLASVGRVHLADHVLAGPKEHALRLECRLPLTVHVVIVEYLEKSSLQRGPLLRVRVDLLEKHRHKGACRIKQKHVSGITRGGGEIHIHGGALRKEPRIRIVAVYTRTCNVCSVAVGNIVASEALKSPETRMIGNRHGVQIHTFSQQGALRAFTVSPETVTQIKVLDHQKKRLVILGAHHLQIDIHVRSRGAAVELETAVTDGSRRRVRLGVVGKNKVGELEGSVGSDEQKRTLKGLVGKAAVAARIDRFVYAFRYVGDGELIDCYLKVEAFAAAVGHCVLVRHHHGSLDRILVVRRVVKPVVWGVSTGIQIDRSVRILVKLVVSVCGIRDRHHVAAPDVGHDVIRERHLFETLGHGRLPRVRSLGKNSFAVNGGDDQFRNLAGAVFIAVRLPQEHTVRHEEPGVEVGASCEIQSRVGHVQIIEGIKRPESHVVRGRHNDVRYQKRFETRQILKNTVHLTAAQERTESAQIEGEHIIAVLKHIVAHKGIFGRNAAEIEPHKPSAAAEHIVRVKYPRHGAVFEYSLLKRLASVERTWRVKRMSRRVFEIYGLKRAAAAEHRVHAQGAVDRDSGKVCGGYIFAAGIHIINRKHRCDNSGHGKRGSQARAVLEHSGGVNTSSGLHGVRKAPDLQV